jgi:hypothetical protein
MVNTNMPSNRSKNKSYMKKDLAVKTPIPLRLININVDIKDALINESNLSSLVKWKNP